MKSISLILLVALFLPLLNANALGQEEVDPNLPARIQKILNLKCGQCHASTIRKPKGAFGFVDDLARVKKTYSAHTNLDDNDLWYYIVDAEEDEIMPPPTAKKGPMSKKQIALLKTWILAGSPLIKKEPEQPKVIEPTKSAKEKSVVVIDGEDEFEASEPITEPSVIAPFHPVLVHFPIALIMVAALMELLRRKQGDIWLPPLKLLLALVLISSVLSGFAGFRAQDAEGLSDATVEWHQWSAIAATALAAIATFLLFRYKDLIGWRLLLYRITLIVSAILYGLTGHEGGILVHGADHFG